MDFRFGRRAGHIPVGLRELPHYAAGSLPQPPAKVDVPQVAPDEDGTPWGILGNDAYGDCGVAGIDHGLMADAAIAGESEEFPRTREVVDYYLGYTQGQDQGVVLSDFLAHVRQAGFFGHTVSAYAPVGVHDIPSLHFAVNAYGFCYTGIRVTNTMMDSFQAGKAWDMDDLLSPVAGGHCVPIIAYDSKALYAVTWGKVQPITYPAWHYMSDEAWAVITGEFTARGDDARGVSLEALQADLGKLAA